MQLVASPQEGRSPFSQRHIKRPREAFEHSIPNLKVSYLRIGDFSHLEPKGLKPRPSSVPHLEPLLVDMECLALTLKDNASIEPHLVRYRIALAR